MTFMERIFCGDRTGGKGEALVSFSLTFVSKRHRSFLPLLWMVAAFANSIADAQGPLAAMQAELEKAIAAAEASVVAIARVRQGEALAPTDPAFVPSEYATGVVVGPNQILTNYHVLGDPDRNDYWVWLRGTPYRVTKVERPRAADPWLDLALLQIGAEDLQPIRLGDASTLKKGHWVIALGNPYAIARDGDVSATLGIVSNLRRKAPPFPGQEKRETLHQLGTLIQVDARLPRGASGGALINLKGELVGLTMSLAALAEEEAEAGFAIPVDGAFQRALGKLKTGVVDDYGYLGVLPAPLPLAERREGKRGVVVQNVMPGTPAAVAQLRRLDVIIEVDGVAVENPDHLVRLVSSQAAGAKVELTLLRGDDRSPSRLKRQVALSKKRVSGELPVLSEAKPVRWRGATIEYLTAMPDYPFHSYKVDAQGSVGLLSVERESPVHKAGFRSGDYVSHVNGQRVTAPQEFLRAVQRKESVRLRRPASEGNPAEDLEVKLAP